MPDTDDPLEWLREQVPDYKGHRYPIEVEIIDDLMLAIEDDSQHREGRAASLITFLATFRKANALYQAGVDDALKTVYGYSLRDMITVAFFWLKDHPKGKQDA